MDVGFFEMLWTTFEAEGGFRELDCLTMRLRGAATPSTTWPCVSVELRVV